MSAIELSAAPSRWPRVKGVNGVTLTPALWAPELGRLVATKMGRPNFDFTSRFPQTRQVSFLRQIVWAHLRYGMSTGVGWPTIGKIANRDHTTIISGIRSLHGRIERDGYFSDRFDDIALEVARVYPCVSDVRHEMALWVNR